jgi:uncharacterized integral membrane protein (TIGR00698 family)
MKTWSEDTVAILLGIVILCIAVLVFLLMPYAEVAQAVLSITPGLAGNLESWLTTADFGSGISVFLKTLLSGSRPSAWGSNPLTAFPPNVFIYALVLFALLALLLGVGVMLMKEKLKPFVKGFGFVFLVSVMAYLLAAQTEFRSIGLGYALWAIVLGLFIGNAFGIPDFIRPALKHELFIKTGLVLLGAEVLFGRILAIGVPGIFVAWIVTPVVLISTFWFGQRILKIGSKTLNITISAGTSVCGVSAAIATAAACKATKEELTTAIGLSMIFTSIMMVAMPAFINAVGMPEILGGAWMGGTIDATGAVVAAGAFLGDTALNVAATIKMIQNILIGVLAFGVAVYWTAKVDRSAGQDVTAIEIWNRFPKFVLGFIGTSLFFSLLYEVLNSDVAIVLIDNGVLDFSSDVRTWLFCLAFASIGLSTNFKELSAQFSGGKAFILYFCGQSLNLGLTLLMAWIMFYKVFPEITNSLS